MSAVPKYSAEEYQAPASFVLKGPGLMYCGGWYTVIRFHPDYAKGNADAVASALSKAYEAGRQSMATDLRALIGAK